MKFLFIHARVTLEYFSFKGRMYLKGLLFTSIASVITAAANDCWRK